MRIWSGSAVLYRRCFFAASGAILAAVFVPLSNLYANNITEATAAADAVADIGDARVEFAALNDPVTSNNPAIHHNKKRELPLFSKLREAGNHYMPISETNPTGWLNDSPYLQRRLINRLNRQASRLERQRRISGDLPPVPKFEPAQLNLFDKQLRRVGQAESVTILFPEENRIEAVTKNQKQNNITIEENAKTSIESAADKRLPETVPETLPEIATTKISAPVSAKENKIGSDAIERNIAQDKDMRIEQLSASEHDDVSPHRQSIMLRQVIMQPLDGSTKPKIMESEISADIVSDIAVSADEQDITSVVAQNEADANSVVQNIPAKESALAVKPTKGIQQNNQNHENNNIAPNTAAAITANITAVEEQPKDTAIDNGNISSQHIANSASGYDDMLPDTQIKPPRKLSLIAEQLPVEMLVSTVTNEEEAGGNIISTTSEEIFSKEKVNSPEYTEITVLTQQKQPDNMEILSENKIANNNLVIDSTDVGTEQDKNANTNITADIVNQAENISGNINQADINQTENKHAEFPPDDSQEVPKEQKTIVHGENDDSNIKPDAVVASSSMQPLVQLITTDSPTEAVTETMKTAETARTEETTENIANEMQLSVQEQALIAKLNDSQPSPTPEIASEHTVSEHTEAKDSQPINWLAAGVSDMPASMAAIAAARSYQEIGINPTIDTDNTNINPMTRYLLRHLPEDVASPEPKQPKDNVVIARAKIESLDISDPEVKTHEDVGITIQVKKQHFRINDYLEHAYESLMHDDYGLAIQYYNAILAKNPNQIDALFGLAATYHRSGDLEAAREFYGKVLSLEPDNLETLNNLLVLASQESPEDALQELALLESKNPHYDPIPAQMAAIYGHMQRFDDAIDKMRRAIQLAPNNMTYRYNMAVLLDNAGYKKQAISIYNDLKKSYLNGEKIPADINTIQERLTFLLSNMSG